MDTNYLTLIKLIAAASKAAQLPPALATAANIAAAAARAIDVELERAAARKGLTVAELIQQLDEALPANDAALAALIARLEDGQ